MKFGSLFSGIGGFDLGFERAGMECAWQCEIDAKARDVLRKHWPDVPIVEDVRDVGRDTVEPVEPVDLICGGFPCQDLSVAGKRAGLAGERSGLWFEFARIVEELKPRWVVVENVPGLLSSNRGADFAVVLQGLVERGYGVAWRVLDAQYFGVAQRRRRVFIVASLGDGRAAEVLFEREGVRWNPPARRKAGEGIANAITARFGKNGGAANDDVDQGRLISGTLDRKSTSSNRGSQANECEFIVSPTLRSEAKGSNMTGDGHLNSNLIAFNADRDGQDASEEISPTILHKGDGDKAHQAYQKMAVAFGGNNTAGEIDIATAQNAHGGTGRHDFESETFVCWEMSHADEAVRQSGDIAPNLQARMGTGGNQVPLVGVRRLTPTECARLQGFPDDWNDWLADSSRYRQFGNAVAVPCAEWLGRRIVEAERGR